MILVLTVVLVLVVATGVVAVLALSRRSADDWKGVIKREGEEIREDVKTHSLPKRASSSDDGPVVPRTASLQSLLQSADSSNAYFDADRLPGIDRLENVTERAVAASSAAARKPAQTGPRGRDGSRVVVAMRPWGIMSPWTHLFHSFNRRGRSSSPWWLPCSSALPFALP